MLTPLIAAGSSFFSSSTRASRTRRLPTGLPAPCKRSKESKSRIVAPPIPFGGKPASHGALGDQVKDEREPSLGAMDAKSTG